MSREVANLRSDLDGPEWELTPTLHRRTIRIDLTKKKPQVLRQPIIRRVGKKRLGPQIGPKYVVNPKTTQRFNSLFNEPPTKGLGPPLIGPRNRHRHLQVFSVAGNTWPRKPQLTEEQLEAYLHPPGAARTRVYPHHSHDGPAEDSNASPYISEEEEILEHGSILISARRFTATNPNMNAVD